MIRKLLTPQAVKERWSQPVHVLLDPTILADWMERGWYQPSHRFMDNPQQYFWIRVSEVTDNGDGTAYLTITTTMPEGRE